MQSYEKIVSWFGDTYSLHESKQLDQYPFKVSHKTA